MMADCERGLGRPDRALDVVRSPEAQDLDAPGKVELAIVASGARADLGQLDAAVAELEIPQLDINRAFSYSPRLFRAYADALTAAGRAEEAEKWQRQALVAEDALGIGQFEEPDIIDLGWDEEQEEEDARARSRATASSGDSDVDEDAGSQAGHAETAGSEAGTAENRAAAEYDVELDDAETDYFESDDPESDLDSVEDDLLDDADAGADVADTDTNDADSEAGNAGGDSGGFGEVEAEEARGDA
jgi:hypothetical protein